MARPAVLAKLKINRAARGDCFGDEIRIRDVDSPQRTLPHVDAVSSPPAKPKRKRPARKSKRA